MIFLLKIHILSWKKPPDENLGLAQPPKKLSNKKPLADRKDRYYEGDDLGIIRHFIYFGYF